jgi:hypothetical protein
MESRCRVNLDDALEDAIVQFLPGLDSKVTQERSCHLAKQGFDNVEL